MPPLSGEVARRKPGRRGVSAMDVHPSVSFADSSPQGEPVLFPQQRLSCPEDITGAHGDHHIALPDIGL